MLIKYSGIVIQIAHEAENKIADRASGEMRPQALRTAFRSPRQASNHVSNEETTTSL